MEMSKYILSLLLSELNTVMSWGFSTPLGITNGLLFHVQGFKHNGWVFIGYNSGSDLFDIQLYNTNKSKADSITDIYAEDLVSVIDERVEKVVNYKEEVENWINHGI